MNTEIFDCDMTFTIPLALAMLIVGAGTASADEPNDGEQDEETTSSETPGSELIAPENTGLDLGSNDMSTDDALARVGDSEDETDGDAEAEAEADASVSNAQNSGETNPCEPYPSCARADLGNKSGELRMKPFQDVARSNAGQLTKCFDGDLAEGESATLVLDFTVGAEGEVEEIRVERSTLPGDDAASCAKQTVSNWEFPEPSEFGYGSVSLSHPFSFRSGN